MKIREMQAADLARMAEIYNHYVEKTTISFEEAPIDAREMGLRLDRVAQAGLPRLVLEEGGLVQGFAYAAPWHYRSAYRLTVETSIYLAAQALGQGLGTRLYGRLIEELKARAIRQAIGVVALPNQPCVRLHEKLGFTKAGQFKDVGFKFGQWISVSYWQLGLAD